MPFETLKKHFKKNPVLTVFYELLWLQTGNIIIVLCSNSNLQLLYNLNFNTNYTVCGLM